MKSRLAESAIWAVDPFSKEIRPLSQARLALAAWEKSEPLDVRPVSVVSPPPELVMTGDGIPWEAAYSEWSAKTLAPQLRRLPPSKVKPPAMLLESALWRGESVDRLLEYAKKSRARVIVAGTHVRKGMGLSRLGGFTQTLIERSPIPVLTVRPSARVPRTFSRMMFMTDFSAGSRRAFRRFLDIAESFGSKVVIFHRLTSPELPLAEYPIPMAAQGDFLASLGEANERRWTEVGEQWKALAEERGLRAELVLSRDILTLSESVERAARKVKADLIAMAIEPHPVTRLLLGSSASEIVQSSAQPVLIFRSSAASPGRRGAPTRRKREMHS